MYCIVVTVALSRNSTSCSIQLTLLLCKTGMHDMYMENSYLKVTFVRRNVCVLSFWLIFEPRIVLHVCRYSNICLTNENGRLTFLMIAQEDDK